MSYLGVNIDHIATVRQARRGLYPDPVEGALICQKVGANSIVAHLREDRRHIQDKDIFRLKKTLTIPLNLEMSIASGIVEIACKVLPAQVTLVPEKRQELTTEGGLDVIKSYRRLKSACQKIQAKKIPISLFIDPDKEQIQATKDLGIDIIEIHTGRYADATTKAGVEREFKKIMTMTAFAHQLGLVVNAGHGLKYDNTKRISKIPYMNELNIGHSIITRSIFVGLPQAVKEMKALCR